MKTEYQYTPIELWGGVECTVNRVRDRYFNQLDRSGHWRRETDLDRFAELGLHALRFPLLWETLAPDSPESIDWSWADRRLTKLRALGIRPIVGLLHHGSGPRYTDLIDPLFPKKFARFAGQVARRYPWIDAYAPINEPLTTARFSALYGHWYPHEQCDASFARAILNESRATILAMEEIRNVNPNALLVQTEDLGRTYSTRAMKYQGDFDNERRWLTWDLLLGYVRPGSPMWDYFIWAGVSASDLDFFRKQRCRVDILGINHYVTSDRYLDENVHNYPHEVHGRNHRHVYADDAAVRARHIISAGFSTAIAEAHNRYALPMALTEVHLGSTVDEQMRWFHEAWQSSQLMRERGMDIRAVTTWALLGSFDWDSLVTRQAGNYEAGAFELRDDHLHPTALANMLKILARDHCIKDPSLELPGWWRKRSRLRPFLLQELAA
jgi:dTDP-4-dehydrorhamnose reductase